MSPTSLDHVGSDRGADEGASAVLTRFSTMAVPVDDRITLWEEYNEEELFGLRCSSLSDRSLMATQTNLVLPQIRITHIQGNDHVIERSQASIREHPADVIMLCLLLKGNAFLYDRTGCETLTAGDAVVYDTERPFVYGFATDMQMVLIEVPKSLIDLSATDEGRYGPRVLRLKNGPAETQASLTARAALARISGEAEVNADFEGSILDAFHLLTGTEDQANAHIYVTLARAFIRQHLHEDLSVEHVAREIGVSSRHLTRLFAEDGSTPARFMTEQRMERAATMLTQNSTLSIGQIAARVGIGQPERFSRVFKSHFGVTPRAFRADS